MNRTILATGAIVEDEPRIRPAIPRHTDALNPPRDRFKVAADLCPELIGTLTAARKALFIAVRANVQIPDFDPADHIVVKMLDETLRRMSGEEPPR